VLHKFTAGEIPGLPLAMGALCQCTIGTWLIRHCLQHPPTTSSGLQYNTPPSPSSALYQFFVLVTYGRGSVLLWRRCDTLCTSGFVDDVILAHKPRQLNVAAQPTCSLGLGYKRRVGMPVAGHLTHTRGPILVPIVSWAD